MGYGTRNETAGMKGALGHQWAMDGRERTRGTQRMLLGHVSARTRTMETGVGAEAGALVDDRERCSDSTWMMGRRCSKTEVVEGAELLV